jgi:uncharacterized repeat protein (TIGR03806 family)
VKSSWIAAVFITSMVLACSSSDSENETQVQEITTAADAVENSEQSSYGKTKLSDYSFFIGQLNKFKPAENVIPYKVNAPLFSDYASKARFIYLPEGEHMGFQEKEVFDFPDSTVIIKNFFYTAEQTGSKQRILETRLLLKIKGEWSALPYIWNNDQTEAYLDVTGGSRMVTLKDHGTFEYVIPNFKQCKNCHDYNGKFTPIGPYGRQLNNGEQLEKWAEIGLLSGLPDSYEKQNIDYHNTSYTINERARSYLDGNCSYCHRPRGSAKNSGLDLSVYSPTDFSLGIYKAPVAAGNGSGGLKYDIVPGKPEESILHYRMKSVDPAVMMPELGRSLVHEEGVALIAEWIAEMEEI